MGAVVAALASAGCGSASPASRSIPASLAAEARPIGQGARFHPPVAGPVIGACRPGLGSRVGAHVELFAANRVVLLAPGIGARPPLRRFEGRISGARCFGALITLDPTGVVLVRPAAARPTVADLFRSWGQPLSNRRLAAFRAPHESRVTAFVDGRRWPGSLTSIPLTRHAEIVLEVGPYVPPHSAYRFPDGY